MLLLLTAWACETGLPPETGIPGHWDSAVQLAVEQKSVQFIPPHPNTGQRNQFQFRGAIQAPAAAQVCQRVRVWVEVRYRSHRPGLLVM